MNDNNHFKSPSAAGWAAQIAFASGNLGAIQTAAERASRALDVVIRSIRRQNAEQRHLGACEA